MPQEELELTTGNVVKSYYQEDEAGVQTVIQKGEIDLEEVNFEHKQDIGLVDRHLEVPVIVNKKNVEGRFGDMIEIDPELTGSGDLQIEWKLDGQVISTEHVFTHKVRRTGDFEITLFALNTVGQDVFTYTVTGLAEVKVLDPVEDAEAGTITYVAEVKGQEPIQIIWYVDGVRQAEKTNTLVLDSEEFADAEVTCEIEDASGAKADSVEDEPDEPEVVNLVSFDAVVDSAAIEIGATATVTAENPLPTGAVLGALTFESSDEETATVDTSGVVTGVASGTVTITVTDESTVTATVDVTVN